MPSSIELGGNAHGSCSWSPKWNKISNPQTLARLRAPGAVDQVTSPNSCQQLLAMANDPNSINTELQRLRQGQQNGQLINGAQSWSTNDYLLFRNGAVDLCKCKMGQGSGATVDVLGNSAPSSEDETVPDLASSAKPDKFIDEQAFAAAGRSSIDDAVQNVLDDNDAAAEKKSECKDLIQYRDTQLEHDFEVAITQRDLYITQREEEFALAKQTLELMDKGWWGGKLTGGHGTLFAEVAIHVKFITDEVNGFLALANPEEAAGATLFTKENLDRVTTTGRLVGITKSAVEKSAEEAAKDGEKTVAWMFAEEIGKLNNDNDALQMLGGLAGITHGALDYEENIEQMERAQDQIQKDVGKLVDSARHWQDKAAEARAKADAISNINRQIDAYCADTVAPQQQGIPIKQPGDQGLPIRPPD